jgi:hypothetical protein
MMIRRFTMTLCAALMLVTLSASPVSALAAPTSVTAESMPGTGSITVNWNSVTGADRHRVQAEIMPYEHLLPERFRGLNERIDERLP